MNGLIVTTVACIVGVVLLGSLALLVIVACHIVDMLIKE